MKAVQEFRKAKNKLETLVSKLFEEGYLDEEAKNSILKKLSQEKIKLGIAGQMKYGKSTFINALIFRKPVLPTSDIPMTATLTYLEYGDQEEYEVEFFSKDEWEDIKRLAHKSPDKKEKEANRERVEEANQRIGKEIENLLGQSRKVSREELYEYVGAEGKYTPITKSLRIKYPHEILKELTIVDTPGFNDPIVSREQEAEKFLREADALIFMLYAGRPLDDTDRTLLVKKIAQSGTGSLVIVMNKYDMLLEEKGSIEAVNEYIQKMYRSIISDPEIGESIKEVLRNAPIVKLSSLMALLGYMPEEEIKEDEDLHWYFEKFKNNFPFLKTQEDFTKYSGMLELEEEIRNLIRENKIKILINKIKTHIEGRLEEQLQKVYREKLAKEQEEQMLGLDLEEIEKRIHEFEDFIENEYHKIMDYAGLLEEIHSIFDKNKEKALKHLQDKFNDINFGTGPERFDLGDYRAKVEREVQGVSHNVETEANELLENAFLHAKDKLKKYVEEKIHMLRTNRVVAKYSNVSYKLLDKIKGSITLHMEHELSMDLLDAVNDIKPKIGKRILFLGEKPEEAKTKAEKYKIDVWKSLERTIKKAFENEKKLFRVKTEEIVLEPIKINILDPIKDALRNAKRNIKGKDKELKEIAVRANELDEKIKHIESIKAWLAKELAEI